VEQFENAWRVMPDHKLAAVRRWRTKAEELREIAMGMTDIGARRLMLNAAANYDHLAEETFWSDYD
jgi:hypothetical protein